MEQAEPAIATVPDDLIIRILNRSDEAGAIQLQLALVSRRWANLICQAIRTLRLAGPQLHAALQVGFAAFPSFKRLLLGFYSGSALPCGFGSSLKGITVLTLCCLDNITSLPCCLHEMTQIKSLRLEILKSLKTIPACFGRLTSLRRLIIYQCPELQDIPGSVSQLTNLTCLLTDIASQHIPPSVESLPRLLLLSIHCARLQRLPAGFLGLKFLDLCVEGQAPDLSITPVAPDNLPSLEGLQLRGDFQRLPTAMWELKALKSLVFRGVRGLVQLPESISSLQRLSQLYVLDTGLKSLPATITSIRTLKMLVIQGDGFESLPLSAAWSLDLLHVAGCTALEKLESSAGSLHVKVLRTNCVQLSNGSDWDEIFEGVQELEVQCCGSWRPGTHCAGCPVPDSIGNLSQLTTLKLPWCIISFSTRMARLSKLSTLVWCTRNHASTCSSWSKECETCRGYGNLDEHPQRAAAAAKTAMALLKLPQLSKTSKIHLREECLRFLKVESPSISPRTSKSCS